MPYASQPRDGRASFANRGVFGEWTHEHPGAGRLVSGLRLDRWQAEDSARHDRHRQGADGGTLPNPTAGAERSETLASGFARVERDLGGKATTLYAGLGRAERFPDYWELFSDREAPDSISAFGTRPERTTQLDLGLLHRAADWSAIVSAFAGAHRRLHPHPLGRGAHDADAHGDDRAQRRRDDARAGGRPRPRVREGAGRRMRRSRGCAARTTRTARRSRSSRRWRRALP